MKSTKKMKAYSRLGLSLVALAISILVFLVMPQIQANAHGGYGGGWPQGQIVRWYYYGAVDLYKDEVAAADDGWNAGQDFLSFLHTTNSSLRNIAVKDVNAGNSYYGITVNFLCNCIYSGAQGEMSLNEDLLQYHTSGFRQRVAAHELGHTIGLRHMNRDNPTDPDYYTTPSIMKEFVDDLSYNDPKPHDFYDLTCSYGGPGCGGGGGGGGW